MSRAWSSFNVTFAATGLACFAAAAIAGHFLPAGYAGFNPLDNSPLRAEVVLERQQREPVCIAFLGDSRTAFSINAADISRPGCNAANLAFPSLGLDMAAHVVDAAAEGASVAVIGVTEPLLRREPGFPWPSKTTEADVGRALLTVRPIRRAYLGVRRTWRFLSAKPSQDDWPYREDLGRIWWEGISARSLNDTPQVAAQIAPVAANYFEGRHPDRMTAEGEHRLSAIRAKVGRLVLFIPPAFPAFEAAAEAIRPGALENYRQSVRRYAAEHGAPLIDCSDYRQCGLSEAHFADAVHVNDAGARILTAYIRTHAALTR